MNSAANLSLRYYTFPMDSTANLDQSSYVRNWISGPKLHVSLSMYSTANLGLSLYHPFYIFSWISGPKILVSLFMHSSANLGLSYMYFHCFYVFNCKSGPKL